MTRARLNSPSSINAINKCRRKFYYKYKLGLPEETSIEMLLGSIVHKAIEEKNKDLEKGMEIIFDELWTKHKPEIKAHARSADKLKEYYQEYKQMAMNWEQDLDHNAKYQCEVPLKSIQYNVLGVIDEISEKDGKIRILDNKTSRYKGISKDHEVQLAIYALLFKENFGKLPDHVGIRFLRDGDKEYLKVNDKLLNRAIYECRMMKVKTISDNIQEYPRTPSPLCNWGKGKCSFLERCFP